MNKKNCDDAFFIQPDLDPSCSPEVIEEWFVQLQSQVPLASTTERLMCIIEIANKINKKCHAIQFTKNFIDDAYSKVVSLAKDRIRDIKSVSKDEDDRHILRFSSGKRRQSATAVAEKDIEKKLKNVWI